MKRAATGKHFIENRAKGKDVRTLIQWTALQLFRRHVTNRAHHHTGIRVDAPCWEICLRLITIELCELCQTKIENLRSPVICDKDVVWLQIAMNDPFPVRCC